MHYIFNKEGVRNILGLSTRTEVNRYEKDAIKRGDKPFIIGNGEKLYDVDVLLNTKITKKETKNKPTTASNNHGYKDYDLECFQYGVLF